MILFNLDWSDGWFVDNQASSSLNGQHKTVSHFMCEISQA